MFFKIEWFQRFTPKKRTGNVIQSWDTNIYTGKHADPSVCLTAEIKDGVIHVIDVDSKKLEYHDLRRWVCEKAEQYDPEAILLEDTLAGMSLIQDLRYSTGLPIIAIQPTRSKLERMARVVGMIEAGVLSIPKQAPWLGSFTSEVMSFPHGRSESQVDSLTQMLEWYRGRQKPKPVRRI